MAGLIEKEIEELRELNVKVSDGTISKEEVLTKIAVYSQVEKRMNLLLRAYVAEAKYGKKAPSSLLIEAK